jgi:phenylalanyl-tRNA synthetase alpha chain
MAELESQLQALEEIVDTAVAAIEAANISADLEALRVEYLGKKGKITAYLK